MRYIFVSFIGVDGWERFASRIHIEPLCLHGSLIVVEAPLTVKHLIKGKFRFKNRLRKYQFRSCEIIVIRPITLIPIKLATRFAILERIYFYLLKRQLAKWIKGDNTLVVQIFQAYQVAYVKQFKKENATVILDYIDKYDLQADCSDKDRQLIRSKEDDILRSSDLVFATAYKLKREAKKFNTKSYWLPNCVDADFDQRCAVTKEYFKAIPRPIIGHVGNLDQRLDYELINYLADANPKYQFVFVGDDKGAAVDFINSDSYQSSKKRRNIHYVGRVDYDEIYACTKSFDVCAMYFKCTEFLSYVHPNKVYMYLMTGLPVVTLNSFPEIKHCFKDLLYVVDSKQEFSNRLSACLTANDQMRSKRIEFAKRNTNWDRAARRMKLLNRHMMIEKDLDSL